MTVLGKRDIQESIGNGDLEVHRDEGRVAFEPASIDVHLAEDLLVEGKTTYAVDVTDESTYPNHHHRKMEGGFSIPPKQFVLGTTQETVDIPNDLIAHLHGRSSVGRLGLFIENAGLIDPGFTGEITLELFNSSRNSIRLQEGMRIGQITFTKVETPPSVGYSEHNGNKYQGQSKPTPSRLYEDFE